jgi:hypothetical protein
MNVKKISWKTKLGLLLFSFLLVCFLGELGLRIIGYHPPDILTAAVRETYNLNPNGEFIYRGYIEGMFSDFANPVKMNSKNFHDVEHQIERPNKNTFRLMVIGDSYVAALSCPLERTFFRRLEVKLKKENPLGRDDYEVIACGQGNQAQEKETKYVTDFAPIYKPDMVLLLFFGGNDIMENLPETFREAQHFAAAYKTDIAPKKIRFFNHVFIFRQSRFNGFIAELLTSFYAEHLYWFTPELKKDKIASPELGVYHLPLAPVWQKAYQRTAELLLQLKIECAKNGAPLLIAGLSGPQAIGDLNYQQMMASSATTLDPMQPSHWLATWCKENNVPYIGLEPVLSSAGKKKVFWRHDGHLNPYGNEVIVDPIYRLVTEQISKR